MGLIKFLRLELLRKACHFIYWWLIHKCANVHTHKLDVLFPLSLTSWLWMNKVIPWSQIQLSVTYLVNAGRKDGEICSWIARRRKWEHTQRPLQTWQTWAALSSSEILIMILFPDLIKLTNEKRLQWNYRSSSWPSYWCSNSCGRGSVTAKPTSNRI